MAEDQLITIEDAWKNGASIWGSEGAALGDEGAEDWVFAF